MDASTIQPATHPIDRAGVFVLLVALAATLASAASPPYLGFDANEYPGDAALPALRRSFSFAGYWLNNPPGAKTNDWAGKRTVLLENGFGFLVLFNGRTASQLKSSAAAAELGKADAQSAVALATREGFHPGAVIFLDQEEGGRMTDAQNAYIFAWTDTVIASGFRAGIYCSGIPAKEGHGQSTVTANDIRARAGGRQISYFVYNDACPPSSGCVYPAHSSEPSASGVAFASVWQFAQSPRRREFTKRCATTYNADGNCYALGAGAGSAILDLDSASSPDPSNGRD
ncbi:MAG: glycoside hydrolase domain-containing protein [Candidatus Acidiferrales bacterium]